MTTPLPGFFGFFFGEEFTQFVVVHQRMGFDRGVVEKSGAKQVEQFFGRGDVEDHYALAAVGKNPAGFELARFHDLLDLPADFIAQPQDIFRPLDRMKCFELDVHLHGESR